MTLRQFAWALLAVQVLTYVALSPYYFSRGNWRLGASQLLLAVVQGVLYSGGI